jgi:hypothetical protein
MQGIEEEVWLIFQVNHCWSQRLSEQLRGVFGVIDCFQYKNSLAIQRSRTPDIQKQRTWEGTWGTVFEKYWRPFKVGKDFNENSFCI